MRRAFSHLVKIEAEVDTLAQLEEALGAGVDAVLLDNMSLEDLRRAVAMMRQAISPRLATSTEEKRALMRSSSRTARASL